jgi:hypothetical protein
MTEKEKKDKKKYRNGGRKYKFIDWDKVDRFLEAGCSGVEIAAYIGVFYSTLYDRCVIDKNMSWTEYSQNKKAKGESMLRAKQFEIAMKGDKAMLVWLGKNRLNQSDRMNQQTEIKGSNINVYIPENGRGDCELKREE